MEKVISITRVKIKQLFSRTNSIGRGRLRKESDGSEASSRWGFRRRDRSGQHDSGRPPSVESSHEFGGFTRGSFRFSSSKSRKSSSAGGGPDAATLSDIFRRKASTKSTTNEALHSPSSGTPSSDAFFGGSGNTTPSVTSPPPHGGHYSGFSSPTTFSPPLSPPPLQPAQIPSSRLRQQQQMQGNVFAPASEANALTSTLSHQPIVLRPGTNTIKHFLLQLLMPLLMLLEFRRRHMANEHLFRLVLTKHRILLRVLVISPRQSIST